MKLFKSTTFTWWQLGLLKWAVLFIGIVVGATWPDIFAPYSLPLLGLGFVFSSYLALVWMKNK